MGKAHILRFFHIITVTKNGEFPMFLFLLKYFFVFSYAGGGGFPKPMSAEEEKFWLKKLREGDITARNKLIEHNLRLVAHITKKYANYQKEAEDFISVGTIGLIKAISTFNADKGSKLATYAARCIENEILMCIRSVKKYRADISLQDPIGTDKDGNQVTLQDKIADESKSIEDRIEDKLQLQQVAQKMSEVLTEREKLIICLRYGLQTGKEVTQREIAEMLGISRSYVSRIETRALRNAI